MGNPIVVFDTTMGKFKAEIFMDSMPLTSANFIELVKDGFYDRMHFHRVIAGFMIQFGCPYSREPKSTRAGTGGPPHGTIADEFLDSAKFSNQPGTLSMANTGRPNSGGSQFFINAADNSYLDWFSPASPSKHPVFGKIVEGMDIVHRIERTPCDQSRPQTPVQVHAITVEGSYYKEIDGKKYDRAILMLAEKAVAGLVQGQISLFDAKAILAAVKDANTYTDIEMDTLRYLRDHYKWAGEADTHFRNAINAWNLEGHD